MARASQGAMTFVKKTFDARPFGAWIFNALNYEVLTTQRRCTVVVLVCGKADIVFGSILDGNRGGKTEA